MEQNTQNEQNRRRPVPSRRILLLAGLTLLILAGILGTIFVPRVGLEKHPSLLSATQIVQGAFSPFWSDKHTVLLSIRGMTFYTWNLSKKTLTKDRTSQCVQENSSMAANTIKYVICSFEERGTIQVFDQLTGTKTIDYNDHRNHSWGDFTLSNDGTQVAFVSDQEVFQIWDLQTGKIQLTLQLPHATQPPDIAWSPDKQKLAAHYKSQGMQIWDLPGKRLLYNLTGPGITDNGHLAWSSDSNRLGFADATYDKTLVDIWEASTGKLFLSYQMGVIIETDTFQLLAGGPSFLLTTGNNQVVLVNAVTQHVLLNQIMPFTYSLQVSPDTNLLELTNGKTIEIYDTFTGQKVATYAGLTGGYGTEGHFIGTPSAMPGNWSPDSQSIASAGQDALLHVWNARTGQDRARYNLHVAFPSAIAWSPDGSMIALATSHGNVSTPVSLTTSIQETVYVVAAP